MRGIPEPPPCPDSAQHTPHPSGGSNGVIFHKYADNDWGYRRYTWRTGPTFVPDFHQPDRLTLLQILDRIESHAGDKQSPRWEAWKTDHPDTFGTATLADLAIPEDHS